ncbi:MAG: hypothetical protein P4L53_21285 [Candidatus Obscuribacterales bacterium]|nr:hypothetical protein [Candidatus Obscuribacterales bacterium]
MADRTECRPEKSKDTSLLTSIVGDSLVEKQGNPGRLNEAIQGLNKQDGPQQLADLQKYLNSTCHSDIANQLLPNAQVGAKSIDFDSPQSAAASKDAGSVASNDLLDDPRNALYNRSGQVAPDQDTADKQNYMKDRFEHHSPRTNLHGSLAASQSGDAISKAMDKDANFEKTGDLSKDEQKAIFDRMDPAKFQSALNSLEQSANKNLTSQRYRLELHREFDKDGRGTEVIDVIDSKTQAPTRTYQRDQRPVDPALHVVD